MSGSTGTKSFIANSRAVAGSTVAQGMSGMMFGVGGGMGRGMGRARAAYKAGSMAKFRAQHYRVSPDWVEPK